MSGSAVEVSDLCSALSVPMKAASKVEVPCAAWTETEVGRSVELGVRDGMLAIDR
jgi:hypothetical protein